ncbi:MAG: sigma-70 family RNA polymerase sigma factor [Thermomicrobiales bacterium]
MTTSADGDLVAQALVDARAFGALYDRYVDDIYGYCALRLGSREAAEDATSLIFAKALGSLARLRGPSFRAWLFGIAHHVVMDVYRSARPTLSLDAALHLDDPAASLELAALDDESTQILVAALASLSPDQRQVIELRLAGLTTAEISTALARSPGAISVAHHRAVRRLRTLLRGAGKEDLHAS